MSTSWGVPSDSDSFCSCFYLVRQWGITPMAVYSQLRPCSRSWLSIFHCLTIDCTNFWVLAIDCNTIEPLSVSCMLWMQAATILQYGNFINVLLKGCECTLIISGTAQYGTWLQGLGHNIGVTPTCSETGSELKSHVLRLSLEESWDTICDWKLIYRIRSSLWNILIIGAIALKEKRMNFWKKNHSNGQVLFFPAIMYLARTANFFFPCSVTQQGIFNHLE